MLVTNPEFRKIKSLGFLYEISEDGRIFRNVKSKKQLKIKLDMHHSKAGYYAVWVYFKNKVHRVMIHKAVAECWLGDKPEGYEIDHIDRDAHNNHYTNLRYVTHSQQMKNRKMSDRIIKQATLNCLNYTLRYVAVPVELRNEQERMKFRSILECAEFLGRKYNKKSEYMRHKLRDRRSHIYDYDVTYLRNVETAYDGSTEQGTVQ